MDIENTSDFLFYQGHDGKVKVQIVLGHETVWATQSSMAEIFDTDVSGISRHIQNIFKEGEVLADNNLQKVQVVGSNKPVTFYSLDVIISVGYRVNSYKATQFRIWATQVLKEYMIKGFALDDDRLKQGKEIFGKDYFDELLERIKEIRTSERRFYQKITDIYAQCSIDYDPGNPITKEFYAIVQNKLHYAVSDKTAAEIIYQRADSSKQNMGLTTWKNAPDGKILKLDTEVAKNYLNKQELSELNDIVNFYLDYAELQAKRQNQMKMQDWIVKLDAFLQFNDMKILHDAGKVSAKVAKDKAKREFNKYRVIQDQEYVSDFDAVALEIKHSGSLPESKSSNIEDVLGRFQQENLKRREEEQSKAIPKKETPSLFRIPRKTESDFDQHLKKALNYNPKKENN